jgi:ribosomal protein L37AE/L43A
VRSSSDHAADSRAVRTDDPNEEGFCCPKCGCDDRSLLEAVDRRRWFCNNCSHDWTLGARPFRQPTPQRFASLDDLVRWAGLRRDEVVTLAELGALNAFGYDRRAALWQAERRSGPLEASGGLVGRVGW